MRAERKSEFLRRFEQRASAVLKPHLDVHGDTAPLVKLALQIVHVAEEVEQELGERRAGTAEAAERTRWSIETLQNYAKAKLAGEELPEGWAGLVVEKTTAGYAFVLGSIPEKPGNAAMARPRKPWKTSTGRYGSTVTLREPRVGAALRWDYRHEGKRCREEVYPETYVRRSPTEPVDPVLVRHAENLSELKAAELKLAPVRRREVNAQELTVAEAYALYFDPRREALPTSRSGLTHQKNSRDSWQLELGAQTLWNSVAPADVWGALMRLRQKGKVQTAVKRLQNLRTITRWLHQRMRIRGLEDPTLGLEVKELREGYRERRPRLTREQKASMRRQLPRMTWRTRLFFTLLLGSGTRGIQARTAMRSALDAALEPMPPAGLAPFGWMLFAGVKGQRPHLTYLTLRQRLEVIRAIWKHWDGTAWVDGPLADWERAYQAGEIPDYPLLPSGRYDRNQLELQPISDKALRNQLKALLTAAGVEETERLGFHAARRAWADLMNESEGLETATAAGGWHDPKTVEGTYLSEYRHELLERARRRIETEENAE